MSSTAEIIIGVALTSAGTGALIGSSIDAINMLQEITQEVETTHPTPSITMQAEIASARTRTLSFQRDTDTTMVQLIKQVDDLQLIIKETEREKAHQMLARKLRNERTADVSLFTQGGRDLGIGITGFFSTFVGIIVTINGIIRKHHN